MPNLSPLLSLGKVLLDWSSLLLSPLTMQEVLRECDWFLGLDLLTKCFVSLSAAMKTSKLESAGEKGLSVIPLTSPWCVNLIGLSGWGLWGFALWPYYHNILCWEQGCQLQGMENECNLLPHPTSVLQDWPFPERGGWALQSNQVQFGKGDGASWGIR